MKGEESMSGWMHAAWLLQEWGLGAGNSWTPAWARPLSNAGPRLTGAPQLSAIWVNEDYRP